VAHGAPLTSIFVGRNSVLITPFSILYKMILTETPLQPHVKQATPHRPFSLAQTREIAPIHS
jgi:hypothetical protein